MNWWTYVATLGVAREIFPLLSSSADSGLIPSFEITMSYPR